MLMTAPGNSRSIFLITGPDNGEKFLVGSSRIRTFAPLKLILKRSTFAFCPPDNSRIGCSISSGVYLSEPRYVLIPTQEVYPCLPSKKGEVLLLGQAEPTMVGIEVDSTTIFKTSELSQSPRALQLFSNTVNKLFCLFPAKT